MTFSEGQAVAFDGVAAEDGLAPGDTGAIMIMTGSGAWVRWDTGALAGCMRLVWLDDLEEHTENAADAAASGG